MTNSIAYRAPLRGEERTISELLIETFRDFVASDCEPRGVGEFLRLARPGALAERRRAGHLFLLAVAGDDPVGVLELRDHRHLMLLFVARRAQRRGIARQLFRRALRRALEARPGLERVTVNSSRYAVAFYERLGFVALADERLENGMVLVPMALDLRREPVR